jgi:hypothetical protein
VRLAERDPPLDQLSGARDYEQGVPILFELGALMGISRVLDRELVQSELNLDLPQEMLLRLVQTNPDDVAGATGPFARFFDAYVGHTPATSIDA